MKVQVIEDNDDMKAAVRLIRRERWYFFKLRTKRNLQFYAKVAILTFAYCLVPGIVVGIVAPFVYKYW